MQRLFCVFARRSLAPFRSGQCTFFVPRSAPMCRFAMRAAASVPAASGKSLKSCRRLHRAMCCLPSAKRAHRRHGHIPLRIVCRCRRSPGRRKYSRRCTAERFRKSAMQCITDLKRRCSPRARRRLRCERLCCAAGLTAQCSAAAARGYSVYFPLRKRRQRKKRLRSCGKRDIGLSFAPLAVRKGTEPSERRETAGAFVPGGKF